MTHLSWHLEVGSICKAMKGLFFLPIFSICLLNCLNVIISSQNLTQQGNPMEDSNPGVKKK